MYTTLILIIFFAYSSTEAQTIIPVEESYKYIGTSGGYLGNNSSVYVKDVNNKLEKFLGTWTGSANGYNYEFTVTKRTIKFGAIKEDELVLHYTITDDQGSVLESTSGLSDDNPLVMKNGHMNELGSYVFSYNGMSTECGQSGDFYFNPSEFIKTSADVYLMVNGEIWPNCDTGPADQIFPQQWMIINK
ncbi:MULTISPECIES: DUF6705 family protein [unclassified Leeuwenhoekiella]|uniref:DUF6705 family protein n=1 Tax=unclassified Leeuwenhoekiella TaxID=2615029 RepID=UPI000C59F79D|nr:MULTISPECIES: DUF6705 family protein [unclassified Leeuwenhoekiella]MAW96934.1 hypothetical protein [Leeuwenhoekiella sp.]MBA80638.1 hypothetical protein [Leeuwenhoekiella sp.]|tara:strand:- start:838 stop:1404 length:567 start_codon:yes stop_codon:yes gene_type:complete